MLVIKILWKEFESRWILPPQVKQFFTCVSIHKSSRFYEERVSQCRYWIGPAPATWQSQLQFSIGCLSCKTAKVTYKHNSMLPNPNVFMKQLSFFFLLFSSLINYLPSSYKYSNLPFSIYKRQEGKRKLASRISILGELFKGFVKFFCFSPPSE